MSSNRLRRPVYGAAMLVLVCFAGCGGGDGTLPTAPVKGKITFDGKPLANAEIWLVPTSEDVKNAKMTIRPYSKTKADGTFTLTSYFVDDGAPIGEYAVMILPAEGRAESQEDQENDMPTAKKATRRPTSAFPAKYKGPTTSGLSYTVKAGPNQLDLDLKSK